MVRHPQRKFYINLLENTVMKKKYIEPEFRAREMAVEESLLAAISQNGDNTDIKLNDDPINDGEFDD
jgi:hypothetical protein